MATQKHDGIGLKVQPVDVKKELPRLPKDNPRARTGGTLVPLGTRR